MSQADVAIKIPTGSGKTLVGTLIAEWRRRSRAERVVVLHLIGVFLTLCG